MPGLVRADDPVRKTTARQRYWLETPAPSINYIYTLRDKRTKSRKSREMTRKRGDARRCALFVERTGVTSSSANQDSLLEPKLDVAFFLSERCFEWTFKCRVIMSRRQAAYEHSGQVYGFSPVCVRKCVERWSLREKWVLHIVHRYGRMPECKRKCRFNISLLHKRRESVRHSNGLETTSLPRESLGTDFTGIVS